jgi:surface carbohydrate biosynthesis protein (TIGR04326 family)
MGKSLTLFEENIEKNSQADFVALWGAFSLSDEVLSIPGMVVASLNELRTEFLDELYKLSKICTNSEVSAKTLKLQNGFFLWWCSLLQEKNYYKTPEIYDELRTKALLKFCRDNHVSSVELRVSQRKIYQWLFARLQLVGIAVLSSSIKPKKRIKLTRKIIGYPLRGILYWVQAFVKERGHIFKKQFIPQLGNTDSSKEITLVSYFPNFDKSKAKAGEFYSHYWGALHSVLTEQKLKVTWVLLYEPSSQCSSREALEFVEKFNKAYEGQQRFILLGQTMTIKSWLKLLCEYACLLPRTYFQRKFIKNIIFREAWCSSLYGPALMSNLIWNKKFAQLFSSIEGLGKCFYIMEGQAWEKFLLYHWRHSQYGDVFAYAHNVIRPFDFRYFESVGLDLSSQKNYFPDKFLLTGDGPEQALLTFNKELANYVLKVESLRYSYLTKLKKSPPKKAAKKKVLLCATDYGKKATLEQLTVLSEAMLAEPELFSAYRLIIKSHPYLPVENFLEQFNFTQSVEITDSPLVELLPQTDFFFASNSTTAVLEAAACDIPFAIAVSASSLNLSPLLDDKRVCWAASGMELVAAIQAGYISKEAANYFSLDSQLMAWRKLLCS